MVDQETGRTFFSKTIRSLLEDVEDVRGISSKFEVLCITQNRRYVFKAKESVSKIQIWKYFIHLGVQILL